MNAKQSAAGTAESFEFGVGSDYCSVVIGGRVVAHTIPENPGGGIEDARRITACLNACEGIPTDALTSVNSRGQDYIFGISQDANQAEAERDALRAEVERLRDVLSNIVECEVGISGGMYPEIFDVARDALGVQS